MLILILVVLVILIALGGLFSWVRRAAACRRTLDVNTSGVPKDVIFGGIMCRGLTTSGSMVKLELFDWGVQIRGIRPVRWIVPTWQARYEELAIAESVASAQSRNGVWLRLRGGSDGMGFLSERSEAILTALAGRQVPVNRAQLRFKRVTELYHQHS